MAKALLINPGFEVSSLRVQYQLVFPFGLGYIAAYAEKYGHEIEVWDIYGKQLNFNEVIKKVKETDFSNYDIIGITGIVNQYLYIKEFTEILKEYNNLRIVLGGPLSSYSWNLILKHTNVDICVIGEGEQTFLELLNDKNLSLIDGIAFKKNGKIKLNKEREQIKNLDEIGFPAFHLFDMDLYLRRSGMMDIVRPYYKRKRVMSLISSRGCPYNCKFCSKSVKGIRMKSLDFLFKEIDYYKRELKVDAIHFVDELLLLNKKRFLEFCNRIKGFEIYWDCQGRINLVDKEILNAMKVSNGILIGFGIESGSQKILNAMNKRIKTSDIKNVLLNCVKINLPVKIQLIFGYPGENRKTLNDTILLFKESRIPGRRFAVITPLPGAPLYEEAKRDGFIGYDKSDSISEEKYLEFLSKHIGYVSPELFYNRTEFSDDNFFLTLKKVENIIFFNFIKTIILHPFYFAKHWFVYKMYLRDWWHYRRNLYFFNIRSLLFKVLRYPKKYLRI